jgi:hypothetical protein
MASPYAFKKRKGLLSEVLSISKERYLELGTVVARHVGSADHFEKVQIDIMSTLSELAQTPQELFLLGMFYHELLGEQLYKEDNIVNENTTVN